MFEKILLPLDGSEISEMALPYGEELAKKLGSELILYHVRGHDHISEFERIHRMYLERVAANVENNLKNGPRPVKEIKLTTRVDTGEPTQNICNFVDNNNINLIIMAGVSVSGINIGKDLGSVTDQVCRKVSIPVMLIRPQTIKNIPAKEQLFNSILLPHDGSDLSKLALPVAEELSKRMNLRLTIFQMANIFRPLLDPSGSPTYVDYTKLHQIEENRVINEMAELQKAVAEKGINVSIMTIAGLDAAEEIIKTVTNVGADLVIMSTHGRTGVGRWVFGNVAEKVLRHGETPLLLIHANA
jgi:nucleotide-binding universal stress UspA family protein